MTADQSGENALKGSLISLSSLYISERRNPSHISLSLTYLSFTLQKKKNHFLSFYLLFYAFFHLPNFINFPCCTAAFACNGPESIPIFLTHLSSCGDGIILHHGSAVRAGPNGFGIFSKLLIKVFIYLFFLNCRNEFVNEIGCYRKNKVCFSCLQHIIYFITFTTNHNISTHSILFH